jgi:anti-anti-sigma factor
MSIERWSDSILKVELQADPAFTDDLAALLEQTEGESPCHVVLDFSGVSYVNSSNIAKLLKLRRQLQDRKRRLVLCSIDTSVWGMFLVTGLDKVFEFTDNLATALASVQLSEQR